MTPPPPGAALEDTLLAVEEMLVLEAMESVLGRVRLVVLAGRGTLWAEVWAAVVAPLSLGEFLTLDRTLPPRWKEEGEDLMVATGSLSLKDILMAVSRRCRLGAEAETSEVLPEMLLLLLESLLDLALLVGFM